MRTSTKKDKIQDALELLNEAAHDKKEEVYEMLQGKYTQLRDVFENVAENGHDIADNAKKKIVKELHAEEKKIKQVAANWDKKLHRDPWVYVGGAAFGSLVLGLILGRKH